MVIAEEDNIASAREITCVCVSVCLKEREKVYQRDKTNVMLISDASIFKYWPFLRERYLQRSAKIGAAKESTDNRQRETLFRNKNTTLSLHSPQPPHHIHQTKTYTHSKSR